MDYEKTLENIQKALVELVEENRLTAVIVEGEKDISALRELGLKGKLISLNSGASLTDFCDDIAKEYENIIILTDWDKKGGFLCRTICKNLEGRVKCDTYFREIFAKNSLVKTIEGLPTWIKTIKNKIINKC